MIIGTNSKQLIISSQNERMIPSTTNLIDFHVMHQSWLTNYLSIELFSKYI